MKQQLQKLAAKIDALTLRERVIVFVVAALALVMLFNLLFLDAQYVKQKKLSDRISQEQTQITAARADIQQKTIARQADPDAQNKVRLKLLRAKATELKETLTSSQKELVPPDRMVQVLEDLLRGNGRLKLVSMKKLPVLSLNQMAQERDADDAPGTDEQTKNSTGNAKAEANLVPLQADPVFSHRVQIVVRGSYLDMLDYLEQLEKMPWRLNWSNAKLDVDDLGEPTLALTLFTLSLDRKWLNL